MKFQTPEPEIQFPAIERKILDYWKKNQVFKKSIESRSTSNIFRFYDGPPFATGLPHYGHLLAGTIKDVVPRFWTMKGKRVERRFGWDCHGLPIEFELEKSLNLNGPKAIREYGIDKFNEACRNIVQRYTTEWKQSVERSGRWIDMENVYRTMDPSFMESVWSIFKSLWDRGLVYEDKKVLPYSARIATPLSNFEANLNYKDVQDPSVTVKCELTKESKTFFLIWTTTPWTLPANLAIVAHPSFTYAKVKDLSLNENYWIAEKLIPTYFKDPTKISVVDKKKGKELAGISYSPLIPCFEGKDKGPSHRVLLDEYVTDDSGTGFVHQAPAFGEDDYRVCRREGIPVLDHTDEEGVFTEACPLFKGLFFKDADREIIKYLKEKKLLFRHETITHSYPFCYRSETPLMYKAISTWFIKVTQFKDLLMKNNQEVHWVPEHLKEGRFGKWLENARDWAISRNRFWGNPIPIWKNAKTGETLCLGSIAELEKLSGKKVTDLHKHFIDHYTIKSPKSGDTLTRIPEIFDCWFESGSMPYAEHHYPFECSEAEFAKKFPADFIAEGLDQTRGWFYTLSAISAGLGRGPAFKNVVVNGMILAEDGKKMSKSLKNYPDPQTILDTHGADALRIYLLQSGAVYGEPLNFSESGLSEMVRKVLLPLWNAYSFFATYASVDQWDSKKDFKSTRTHELDQWITIKMEKLKSAINHEMENFQLARSVPPLLHFLDDFTNWYIRRSRRRFWKSENDKDKLEAYSTLYSVLLDFVKVAAPFIPFITDEIYRRLTGEPSVHLALFPEFRKLSEQERAQEETMDRIQQVVFLGRELREKVKIKVRQPLAKLQIGLVNSKIQSELEAMKSIILEELNIKTIEFTAFEKIASWKIQPNFKTLGQKLGPKLKDLQKELGSLDSKIIKDLLAGKTIHLVGEDLNSSDFLLNLSPKPEIKFPTHASGDIVIALDTTLTKELEQEGLSRELINRVQKFRKDLGLHVADRIHLHVDCEKTAQQAFQSFQSLIEEETLSRLALKPAPKGTPQMSDTLNGHKVQIEISKIET